MLILELYSLKLEFVLAEANCFHSSPNKGYEIKFIKKGLAIFDSIDSSKINKTIQEIFLNLTGNSTNNSKIKYLQIYIVDFINYLIELREKVEMWLFKHKVDYEINEYLANIRMKLLSIISYFKSELLKIISTIDLTVNDKKVSIELKRTLSKVKLNETIIEVENKSKTKIKERFIYLKEIGGMDSKIFKDLTTNKKKIAISKILDCNIDYARDLIESHFNGYNKSKEKVSDELINKVKINLK
ncbi:hypothetical protein EKK58_10405 [Candidatus Dependentiae bacterium]|nr:MAG: hypothetical protein EKK58_10405 [Candidatus Dependentiae bacterium]